MESRNRDYIYSEATTSLCPYCMKTIPAKIVIKGSSVYLLKHCMEHGEQLELFEEDVDYFAKKRDYDKPGTSSKSQTKVEKGCPFDCGLCPQHDQHSCIGLIEVTTKCNLNCKVCFANAGRGEHLDMEKIGAMMDFYQDSESQSAEILQISGGEPTIHPHIIQIIDMAREKKFKYVMLNTNGLRIAEDEAFVEELSRFAGGFEVYLQLDGFKESTYQHFRGKDLTEIKRKAVNNLTKYKIPTTLVCTLEQGVNDDEVGELLMFAMNTKYIRGINFQPVAYFGRGLETRRKERITLSGVLKRIESQTNGMLKKGDFIPLPCNVERVAITYLYRTKKGFLPITRNKKIKEYLPLINNTFAFNIEDMLKNVGEAVLDKKYICDCFKFISDFKNIIPAGFQRKSKKERIEYIDENTFRISISSFVDAYNFDMKSMQKECVHIITPEMKRIPFSAFNMLYREGSGSSDIF